MAFLRKMALEIIKLYVERWHVKLDFRSIKTMMKMDILRCKSPAMVRKEIDVHLLVYNMIRALMARAPTPEIINNGDNLHGCRSAWQVGWLLLWVV